MATMETDISNPMVFDVNGIKKKQDDTIGGGIGGHEVKKWNSVYTTYYNKNLTLKEGRRVPKELCLENPNIHFI